MPFISVMPNLAASVSIRNIIPPTVLSLKHKLKFQRCLCSMNKTYRKYIILFYIHIYLKLYNKYIKLFLIIFTTVKYEKLKNPIIISIIMIAFNSTRLFKNFFLLKTQYGLFRMVPILLFQQS